MGARDQDRGHQGRVISVVVGSDPTVVIAGLDPAIHPTHEKFLRRRWTRGAKARSRASSTRFCPRVTQDLQRLLAIAVDATLRCRTAANRRRCMYNLHLSPEHLQI